MFDILFIADDKLVITDYELLPTITGYIIISTYSMLFCLISEFGHPS